MNKYHFLPRFVTGFFLLNLENTESTFIKILIVLANVFAIHHFAMSFSSAGKDFLEKNKGINYSQDCLNA